MDYPALDLVTAPAEEPITLAEAKLWSRQDISADDTIFTDLITAARVHLEKITGLALVTQTWDAFFDCWPDGDRIMIPRPPLQSITWLKFNDSAETVTEVATSEYLANTKKKPGRLVLRYAKSWPAATLSPSSPVNIRFVAGFGAAAAVPKTLKQAVFLLADHWYTNRSEVIVGKSVAIDGKKLPEGLDSLIANYASWRI